MREQIDAIFRAALNRAIELQGGRGVQAQIARKTGESRAYINAIKQGRKAGSEEVRRAIAKALGYEYEEFLDIGREILGFKQKTEPEESFKYATELARFGEYTDERANAIRLLACQDAGLEGGVLDYTMTSLGQTDPDLARYLRREMTDEEYYELFRDQVAKKLKWLDDEIEKYKKMRALFKEEDKT